MSRLRVMLRGALISEINLNPEKEYMGGRKDGSDIRLQAEKGISREHFKLKFVEGQWQVKAVSRFGDVFSLGQKTEESFLQHGQSFQVPPYEFTFLEVPDAGVADIAEPPPIALGEHEKTVIGAAPQVPYIKIVNSSGEISEMLRLEVGEVWVAGRDPSCQIIIPDQRVSRRQFEIYKINGAYTVLDLASVNGTFLNGSPISSTDPQTLKSGDAISVLDNIMYFELHDPNFKYKVERIDIPPLQIDAAEEEYVEEEYAEPEEIPQVEQYGVPQQLDIGNEGPFTGMPPGPDAQDANQYYGFQAPPPAPPPPSGIKKLLQNKPLLIALALIILGGAYYLSEMTDAPIVTQAPAPPTADPADPFAKLTPAQQKEVEEYYTLAEQMYSQQKYQMAIEKINKIEELLPTGYKDSSTIKAESEKAILTFVQKKNDEEISKEAAERAEKNQKIIENCKKLVTPDVTSEIMRQCLTEALSFDPNNAEITMLLEKVAQMEADKKQKEEDLKTNAQQEEELRKKFKEAEDVQADGLAFKAIKKYKVVVDSDLRDPNNLKQKSKDRIAFIEAKIKEKSQVSIDLADQLFKEAKIKDAVLTLRNAVIYDPNNKSIKEKIELFSLELKRQVRNIYQESIIDENYGLIDNTETKVGAKDKWRKITELDLEDGEYYRKAVTKLRRYGVM